MQNLIVVVNCYGILVDDKIGLPLAIDIEDVPTTIEKGEGENVACSATGKKTKCFENIFNLSQWKSS